MGQWDSQWACSWLTPAPARSPATSTAKTQSAFKAYANWRSAPLDLKTAANPAPLRWRHWNGMCAGVRAERSLAYAHSPARCLLNRLDSLELFLTIVTMIVVTEQRGRDSLLVRDDTIWEHLHLCFEAVTSHISGVVNCSSARRRGGRVAECGGLLNRCTG